MQGTMIIIAPDKPPQHYETKGPPKLDWLKRGIGGGYIEIVPGFHTIKHDGQLRRCVAFCDDDGKRKQLPVNAEAMALWDAALKRNGHPGLYKNGRPIDTLVGNIAIIIGDSEFLDLL